MRVLISILLLSSLSSFGQMDKVFELISRNNGTKVMSDGNEIRTMGFAETLIENPPVPGVTIEVNEGDSVRLDLFNMSMGAPHTIHLHGLDVDQQNDGVPHLSFAVYHTETKPYFFKAPHAGTYLYHCHVTSTIHVQAGMYGLLIVHPSDGSQSTWDGGYAYDVTQSLLMSEIDTMWHQDSIILHDYDTTMTVPPVQIYKYDPQFFLVNGFSDGQILDTGLALNTAAGAVNYVRLANIGYKGNRVIFPSAFNAQIVDSDGRPLPSVEVSDTVELMPGERYGVLGTMPSEGADLISIEYFDLNTMQIDDTQEVPINVDGVWGIEEYETENFWIYPNPVNDNLTIKFGQLSPKALRIYSVGGQLISTSEIEDPENTKYSVVSVSDLTKGVYVLEVDFVNNKSSRRSFVKE